jgi:hypothetical protein
MANGGWMYGRLSPAAMRAISQNATQGAMRSIFQSKSSTRTIKKTIDRTTRRHERPGSGFGSAILFFSIGILIILVLCAGVTRENFATGNFDVEFGNL